MALVADEAVDEPIVAAFLVKYPGYRLFVEDLEELVRNEKGDVEAIGVHIEKIRFICNTFLTEDCLRQVFLHLPTRDRITFGLRTSKQLHINLRCWNFPIDPEFRWTSLDASPLWDPEGEAKGYYNYSYYASLQGSFLCLSEFDLTELSLRVRRCARAEVTVDDANHSPDKLPAPLWSPLLSACTEDGDFITKFEHDGRYDLVTFETSCDFEPKLNDFVHNEAEITIEFQSADLTKRFTSEPRRIFIAMGYADGYESYCHHGDNLVSMWNGESKMAKHMQVGDIVKSLNGISVEPAVIEGVAINRIQSQSVTLVQLDAATMVTMGHPIFDSHKGWIRPEKKYPLASVSAGAVYNFIVSNRGSILVNGHISSTLGQFCKNIDDENTFFGSERVVNRLKLSSKWPVVDFH